jgi:ABC-type branched-subunit amino acid transport system substrate-binding protein
VSADTIKVGAIMPKSGPRAPSFAPSEDGIRARFEKANQTGELGSRKLSLVVVDDASDAARNGEVARQLVESDKVFGVIEVSDQADGSAEYLNRQGVPVTGWHVGRQVWSTYPNMFTFRQGKDRDPANYTTRNADVVKALGGTKVALVGGGNQSSATFINQIAATMGPDSGLSVVFKTTDIPADQRDFTAVVQRIRESGADSMITGMDFLQNTALSDQLTKAGVNLKVIVFPGGYDPRVLRIPGIEGAVFGLEFKPFELRSPAFVEFDRWLPKDVVRNQVTFIGWLSAETFIEGIKQAGLKCPTRKAFITNLRLVKDWTGGGAFDPVDLAASFGKEFQCVYYVKVQNAAFTPLFDGKEFCGKPARVEI